MSSRVRLIRKFAESLNGVDLSRVKTGEEVVLSTRDAHILIAEGWAALVGEASDKPPRRDRRSRKRTAPQS